MIAKESLAAAAERRFSASSRAAAQRTGADAAKNEQKKRIKPHRVNTPAPKKPEVPKKPDFERSLARLEEVVRRLESPQLSLDDAMKLFEEGVALSRECQKQLEEAEGRVEILLKKADGKLSAEPFNPEREDQP
jgi:exodeoxyribonuclease VII small subunit